MISDGIRINGQHSYVDFGLYVKTRGATAPKKLSIIETVPFYNGHYDFSAINGGVTWISREITYAFDLIGGVKDLEAEAARVLAWLLSAQDTDIFDDVIPEQHYHGSYSGCEITYDDSGEAAEISVTFLCQPYKIANRATVRKLVAGENTVINTGQPVAPWVYSDGAAIIVLGQRSVSLAPGVEVKLPMALAPGANALTVSGADIRLRFSEVRL